MRISTLLETNTTPSSDPAANQSEQAPKFGRDPHVLEDEQLDETTAGAIATGEPTNMGVQRRGKGSMFQGIKTSKKFANSAAVTEMDKSQTPPGRDGGKQGGKEHTAKPVTSKEVQDQALEKLKNILSKPENMAVLKRLKTKEGVAEGLADRKKQEQEADKWLEKRKMKCTCPTSARNNPKCPVHGKKQGVAEGLDAEAYKEKLLATLPQMMRFYEKNVKGWKPSEEQMLAAVETGYTVMKHTGDVKQAGKAVMDELNTLHRMSQGQQGVAEARPEPEQDQMDANRRAALRREREPHGSDKIDAMLAKQNAERREYEQTGKFWLKQKDTQEHLSDAFVGKAAANQAALELLKQKPELKGNLVITAWGPGEKPTNEALKPKSLSALQTAKQNIQKNREQDLASWEQDFRRNFAKKRGMVIPQQQVQEPQASQVAFPGEKHKDLKTRMTGLNAAVEKQKYLDYLTFKAEQRGLMNPGLEADIDTSMYIKDAAKDNYQSLNQKLDKSIEKLKQRMGIHKIAYKKPKVMEDELSEEQLMAKDLFKRLELFNKAQDRELGDKPTDKDIVTKEGQLDREPLPQEFIEKAIYRVLLRQYPEVVQQYGAPIIGDAITSVASMHRDMDHIEAEEAALMLQQVISQLKTHLHMREEKQRLDPKCWKGYKKQGTKMKGDTRVNNCVKIEK